MSEAVRESVLEVNLSNLAHNFNYLKSKVKNGIKMLCVVKANSYGSDAIAIAKKLHDLGADYLAVAYAPEGKLLRENGITLPILVLHPQPVNFDLVIDFNLEPSLYSSRVLQEFIRVATKRQKTNYPVHIKFNSGLNRIGFWEQDVDHIAEKLAASKAVHVVSILSHLAASEDHNEREFTLRQIDSFTISANQLIQKLGYQPILHQSNTSGILNYPEAHFDMVRTGIGLYGYGNEARYDKDLKPIASLKSVISQLHKLEPGESVGYNRAFKAKDYMTSATIPLGHADGINRIYGKGRGFVYIHGEKAPIIGNVCMDMIMVDVTHIDCQEGDEVVVFDEHTSASKLAEHAGTISYELITAISPRVKRVVIS
ncbi:alanine racemase [Aquimarina brevivitae]|uniref:Alanine racemase n=1 Tax=Aquimarina brevivitae TaxID=323412 RepID=A0A4Q7PKM1_9FLAO|nr:alanine racemase [Aquimarina brevivitae]RZS99512.1 alanine racemase [Aquimarina brevivitae]